MNVENLIGWVVGCVYNFNNMLLLIVFDHLFQLATARCINSLKKIAKKFFDHVSFVNVVL